MNQMYMMNKNMTDQMNNNMMINDLNFNAHMVMNNQMSNNNMTMNQNNNINNNNKLDIYFEQSEHIDSISKNIFSEDGDGYYMENIIMNDIYSKLKKNYTDYLILKKQY